ncbi:hypothetical protein O3M35_008454 [Rhynocoris fuscipes]|uniref:Translational activator of cytochrome c oxidase 1 n=1 Tax=Rhynocoris fuscipes TaxID=488301 RepID=A0AAW1D6C7_9HEMI
MLRLLISNGVRIVPNNLTIIKRYAGHSKWANIKHIKAAKDSQRSQLFMKLCQRIKVAIQEGGNANPNSNLHLAQAIEVARKQCMPIASINNCIKSAQADKSKAQSTWYEIRGPSGCLIIALALTDNPKKTKDSIAPILKKMKVAFSSNSAKHNFEHKGVITAKPPADITNVEDVIIDHAIECGAEEVNPNEIEERVYNFTCDLNQLHIVKGKLESLKYNVLSADFEFIPKLKVALDDNQIEQMTLEGNLYL